MRYIAVAVALTFAATTSDAQEAPRPAPRAVGQEMQGPIAPPVSPAPPVALPAPKAPAVGGFAATPLSRVGFAISPTGRVFVSNPTTSDDAARQGAVRACRRAGEGACEAITVELNWNVIGVYCVKGGRKGSFLGGSVVDAGGALWRAYEKAKEAGFVEAECIIKYSKIREKSE